jgi:cytochrome d ubiquinol oxidase subunit I
MGLIMLGVRGSGNPCAGVAAGAHALWATFLSFPTGFVAILSGWFTAEVGRQPWWSTAFCAPGTQ